MTNINSFLQTAIAIAGFAVIILKLKSYEKEIGIMQKRNLEREEEDRRKAVISVSLEGGRMYVRNSGRGDALNLRMEKGPQLDIRNFDELFPYAKLTPGQVLTIVYLCDLPNDAKQTVTFIWDDGFAADRHVELTLALNT